MELALHIFKAMATVIFMANLIYHVKTQYIRDKHFQAIKWPPDGLANMKTVVIAGVSQEVWIKLRAEYFQTDIRVRKAVQGSQMNEKRSFAGENWLPAGKKRP